MAKINSLNELVRRGDEILRIPKPPQRRRQWRRWRDQVVNIMQDIPELKNLGLQLQSNHLAADVGILSRYERLLRTQPEIAKNPEIFKDDRYDVKSKTKKRKDTSDSKSDGKIRIFISHKHEDGMTAKGLKEAIERFGAGRVKIFLSEDTTSGANWIKWIQKSLSDSNLFILVFTDATRNWDWPLYEAGLFTKLDDLESRPLICLHSENLPPPPPLRHLQSVPANVDQIKRFLKNLFIKANLKGISRPLNPSLADQPEELNRAATEIVALVSRHTVKIDFFSKYLFINIGYLGNGKIQDDAKVTSNAPTMELFGLKEGDWLWSDIVAQAKKDEDQRWLNELQNSISDASKGKLFKSIQATLKSHRDSKRYRPMLYRVDTLADGSQIAKILFVEDVSWHISEIPKRLGLLSTALVMSVRFRYEVLKKYEGNFLNNRDLRKKKHLKEELLQSLSNIETDASSRGLLNEKELINIFQTKEEKLKIREMYDDWYNIKNALFLRKKQKEPLIDEQINKLFALNNEFINIGMKRFCELISQEQ